MRFFNRLSKFGGVDAFGRKGMDRFAENFGSKT